MDNMEICHCRLCACQETTANENCFGSVREFFTEKKSDARSQTTVMKNTKSGTSSLNSLIPLYESIQNIAPITAPQRKPKDVGMAKKENRTSVKKENGTTEVPNLQFAEEALSNENCNKSIRPAVVSTVKDDMGRCEVCKKEIGSGELVCKAQCMSGCDVSIHKECFHQEMSQQGFTKKKDMKNGHCLAEGCAELLDRVDHGRAGGSFVLFFCSGNRGSTKRSRKNTDASSNRSRCDSVVEPKSPLMEHNEKEWIDSLLDTGFDTAFRYEDIELPQSYGLPLDKLKSAIGSLTATLAASDPARLKKELEVEGAIKTGAKVPISVDLCKFARRLAAGNQQLMSKLARRNLDNDDGYYDEGTTEELV